MIPGLLVNCKHLTYTVSFFLREKKVLSNFLIPSTSVSIFVCYSPIFGDYSSGMKVENALFPVITSNSYDLKCPVMIFWFCGS